MSSFLKSHISLKWHLLKWKPIQPVLAELGMRLRKHTLVTCPVTLLSPWPSLPHVMWVQDKQGRKDMKDSLLLNCFLSNCSFPLNHHGVRQIWYNMHSSSSWRCLLWFFWSLTGRQQAVSLEHALYYQPLSSILLVFYPTSTPSEKNNNKKTPSTCLHKYLFLLQHPCLELLRCFAEVFTLWAYVRV